MGGAAGFLHEELCGRQTPESRADYVPVAKKTPKLRCSEAQCRAMIPFALEMVAGFSDTDEVESTEDDAVHTAPLNTRDPHVIVSTFVDESRAQLSGAVVKAMDLFHEVGAWAASRAPGAVVSFKALHASLRRACGARSMLHVFGGGETCEAFAFPVLVQAPPAPNKLHEFLTMDDDERGCVIRRVEGRVTWVQDFKAAYVLKISNEQLGALDAAIMTEFGFTVSDKMENVCRGCKQIARARGGGCCPEFDRDARVKKAVIHNMQME